MALRQLKNENRSLFFLHVVESYPTLSLPLHHIILFGFFSSSLSLGRHPLNVPRSPVGIPTRPF